MNPIWNFILDFNGELPSEAPVCDRSNLEVGGGNYQHGIKAQLDGINFIDGDRTSSKENGETIWYFNDGWVTVCHDANVDWDKSITTGNPIVARNGTLTLKSSWTFNDKRVNPDEGLDWVFWIEFANLSLATDIPMGDTCAKLDFTNPTTSNKHDDYDEDDIYYYKYVELTLEDVVEIGPFGTSASRITLYGFHNWHWTKYPGWYRMEGGLGSVSIGGLYGLNITVDDLL